MDTSGVTPQQRHLFKKLLPSLPEEMQKAYADAKSSTVAGHQKEVNLIMNTIIPKAQATGYGVDVQIDKTVITRFRAVMQKRRVAFGQAGFTRTETIGPGKLGSVTLLNEGLARGDIVMKTTNGKEMYYACRAEEFDIQDDVHGRNVSSKASTTDSTP